MSKSSSLSSDYYLRRQPQQQRGRQRLEKILLAAAEVFAEAGFAAATIQQIADLSGSIHLNLLISNILMHSKLMI